MKFPDLARKRRTIRKFSKKELPEDLIISFIDTSRYAPSSRNSQPLEYVIVVGRRDELFACTSWAGSAPEAGPWKGEEPAAYIILLSNTLINNDAGIDAGLAAAHIVLAAAEQGVASCIIGSIDREKARPLLNIPCIFRIEVAIALGYPAQESVAEDASSSKGSIRPGYWLDENSVVHVPKRLLKDILHHEFF